MVYVAFYRLSESLYAVRNNDFTIKEFVSKEEAEQFKADHINGEDFYLVEVDV